MVELVTPETLIPVAGSIVDCVFILSGRLLVDDLVVVTSLVEEIPVNNQTESKFDVNVNSNILINNKLLSKDTHFTHQGDAIVQYNTGSPHLHVHVSIYAFAHACISLIDMGYFFKI